MSFRKNFHRKAFLLSLAEKGEQVYRILIFVTSILIVSLVYLLINDLSEIEKSFYQ